MTTILFYEGNHTVRTFGWMSPHSYKNPLCLLYVSFVLLIILLESHFFQVSSKLQVDIC
uniref:Uncharacterized protein n=1 Tax=Anguilla anguilla TaxID=7936 RepID=A0A0E9TYS9_ANGAN